ncbi:hypothetical protein PAPHI01_1178 [Pancytospora philotis]|nr:hypothetical protein PAPHI01_1178 [Pancytospora philotis]
MVSTKTYAIGVASVLALGIIGAGCYWGYNHFKADAPEVPATSTDAAPADTSAASSASPTAASKRELDVVPSCSYEAPSQQPKTEHLQEMPFREGPHRESMQFSPEQKHNREKPLSIIERKQDLEELKTRLDQEWETQKKRHEAEWPNVEHTLNRPGLGTTAEERQEHIERVSKRQARERDALKEKLTRAWQERLNYHENAHKRMQSS